jgi:hypothetical protein
MELTYFCLALYICLCLYISFPNPRNTDGGMVMGECKSPNDVLRNISILIFGEVYLEQWNSIFELHITVRGTLGSEWFSCAGSICWHQNTYSNNIVWRLRFHTAGVQKAVFLRTRSNT